MNTLYSGMYRLPPKIKVPRSNKTKSCQNCIHAPKKKGDKFKDETYKVGIMYKERCDKGFFPKFGINRCKHFKAILDNYARKSTKIQASKS